MFLNQPVRRICTHNTSSQPPHPRVTVHTDAAVYAAQRVVVAMAPSLVQRVLFDPPLPSSRMQLLEVRVSERALMGCIAFGWVDLRLSPGRCVVVDV